MVVLVFPAAQLRGELAGCPERRAALEFLAVGAVAAFDLAIDLGAARGDMPMGDSKITEMPDEIGAELASMRLFPSGKRLMGGRASRLPCGRAQL